MRPVATYTAGSALSDYFSGLGTAIGSTCVCMGVHAITFELSHPWCVVFFSRRLDLVQRSRS